MRRVIREVNGVVVYDSLKDGPEPPRPQSHEKQFMQNLGPKLWKRLHLRALNFHGHEDFDWLAEFSSGIPCSVCRGAWLGLVFKNPPDFENFFEWTVKLHNLVNVKLGKPEVSFEEARSLYF